MKSALLVAFQVAFTLLLYLLAALVCGVALFPAVFLFQKLLSVVPGFIPPVQILILCIAMAGGYFIFGLSLIVVVGVLRIFLHLKLEEGEHRLPSCGAVRWMVYNSFVLLVSNIFMDFMILTPFAALFYRLMGAKLGKNVQINSKYCADLCLLEIGDGAVIGGHATVICHSVERHRLILKKVKIGKNAIIGLNSVVLPGCEIGDGALIAAGAVLQKNTKVEPREVYFGVPAQSVRERREEPHV